MKRPFYLLLLLAGLSTVFACSSEETTGESIGSSTTNSAGSGAGNSGGLEENTSTEPQPLTVAFDIRELSGPEEGAPLVEISLKVNGTSQILDSVAACSVLDPSAYPNHEMPEEALTACGGWFAGGGDYFYAIEEAGEIVVMVGWQDEMQDDDGYHYEEFKKVSVPASK